MEEINFFQSQIEAVLKKVRPFEIHGARFYEIEFSLPGDPPDSARRARISNNLIYDQPAPGDRVTIEILMGNVNRVSRL